MTVNIKTLPDSLNLQVMRVVFGVECLSQTWFRQSTLQQSKFDKTRRTEHN